MHHANLDQIAARAGLLGPARTGPARGRNAFVLWAFACLRASALSHLNCRVTRMRLRSDR